MRYLIVLSLLTSWCFGAEVELSPKAEQALKAHAVAVGKADAIHEKAVAKSLGTLTAALKREQTRVTKKGDLEGANTIAAVLKKFEDEEKDFLGKSLSMNQRLLQGADISIPSTKSIGYEIGLVTRGTQLSFQYLRGTWKSHGRLSSGNPDQEIPKHTDNCRMALIAVGSDESRMVLTLIPVGTANKPFVWKSARTYKKLILAINDQDGDYDSNPDGGVGYHLQMKLP